MYLGTLPAASTKATWAEACEIIDEETDQPVDISTATEITLVVRDPKSEEIVLSGTLSGGDISLADTGIFQWSFTPEQMGALFARTYEVGCTIKQGGETVQLIIGALPVLDGILS